MIAVNETEHQGFLHGFVESLSVILVKYLVALTNNHVVNLSDFSHTS